jgi:hypothetical protein
MAKRKKSVKRVGFLLDETGSMQVRKAETIVAVNNYFETLRSEKAVVTFATFDTEQGVNFRLNDTPAKEIPDLTEQSYRPNAMTPLHDAVGKMIGDMGQYAQEGDKVLIVIVTDGEENSSREFNLAKVKALIQQKEQAGWAFAYIGATSDAWAGGGQMGVAQAAMLNVDGHQMVGAMRAHSAATADYFAERVTGQSLYSLSRHLVEDEDADKPEEPKD